MDRLVTTTVGCAAAIEAVVLSYAALAAYLTPTMSREHDLIRAVLLLGIAVPLAWHVVDSILRSRRRTDPLAVRVLAPNLALLLMCLTGTWALAGSSGELSAALAAVAASVMAAGGFLLGRVRMRCRVTVAS